MYKEYIFGLHFIIRSGAKFGVKRKVEPAYHKVFLFVIVPSGRFVAYSVIQPSNNQVLGCGK